MCHSNRVSFCSWLQLCRYAQEWANHLAANDIVEHRKQSKYGENLYTISSSNTNAEVDGEHNSLLLHGDDRWVKGSRRTWSVRYSTFMYFRDVNGLLHMTSLPERNRNCRHFGGCWRLGRGGFGIVIGAFWILQDHFFKFVDTRVITTFGECVRNVTTPWN